MDNTTLSYGELREADTLPSVPQIIRRRHNRKQRQRKANSRSQIWSLLVFGGTAALTLGPLLALLTLAGFLYGRALTHLPQPGATIALGNPDQTTRFYDRSDGILIYTVEDPLGDARQWLSIDTLPEHLLDATLQMEDPDYLETGVFRAWRTARQLWGYSLGIAQRRDTSLAGRLTDQTLLPLAADNGLDPALLHLAFSAEIQRRYPPEQILEWYLNTAYYANDAYGIDAAAQVYFGKPARDLTLAESALLAAIPLAPQFNPLDNAQAARDRQLDLLRNMRSEGRISSEQFDRAANTDIIVRDSLAQSPFVAAEFALAAREQAEAILNTLGLDGARVLSSGGVRVTTTLDMETYYQSECIMRAHLAQMRGLNADETLTLAGQQCGGTSYLANVLPVTGERLPDTGSLVVQDVASGEIYALIGDATSYRYEPGPVLHPFVYLAGFLSGNYNPARMVLDIPVSFPGPTEGSIYPPANPDNLYRGPVNLRDAMASGLRAPAAEVAEREGLTRLFSITHQMGFNSMADTSIFDLSIIERGGSVSLLDTVYAYSVFADMGTMQGVFTDPIGRGYRQRDPVLVRRIEATDGTLLWAYDDDQVALSRTPVVSPEFAYLVTDILADSPTRQRVLGIDDTALTLGRPAAVVAGSTSGLDHNWAVGYTPQLVVGVHLSAGDEERMMLDPYGWQGAAPIWQAVMRYAHDRYGYQAASWPRPDSLVQLNVCEKSGLLPPAGSDCQRRTEIFHPQVQPTQEDAFWQTIEVNSRTGQRASSSTPDYLIAAVQYFIPPDDALDWWRSNNLPLPPTEYDYQSVPEALRTVEIFVPEDLAYVRGVVDIRGALDSSRAQSYQLRYGAGQRPTQWFDLVRDGVYSEGTSLGEWDTTGLDGIYTLELSAQYDNNEIEDAAVLVTVDNVPPTAAVITGENDESLFRWPQQTTIPITADVDDNLALDRVEIYHNGILLAEVREAPYTVPFTIERTGTETFTVAVFDQAGNQASAEKQIEVIRSGG